jgi:hypothetical protein
MWGEPPPLGSAAVNPSSTRRRCQLEAEREGETADQRKRDAAPAGFVVPVGLVGDFGRINIALDNQRVILIFFYSVKSARAITHIGEPSPGVGEDHADRKR